MDSLDAIVREIVQLCSRVTDPEDRVRALIELAIAAHVVDLTEEVAQLKRDQL